jgi:hypothetical protein
MIHKNNILRQTLKTLCYKHFVEAKKLIQDGKILSGPDKETAEKYANHIRAIGTYTTYLTALKNDE